MDRTSQGPGDMKEMNVKRLGFFAASIAFLAAAVAAAQTDRRSAYSYVRESTGEVTVQSELERLGRGPEEPADLGRRRGAHR